MQVSVQPYLKEYSFPLFSLTTLVRIIALFIAVALPFFLAYATPNFYLASRLNTQPQPTIDYKHQYHIRITTDTGEFVYSNFYSLYSSRGLTLYESDHKDTLELQLEWNKVSTAQKVREVEIVVGFDFRANSTTQYGLVKGKITGYNIAEGTIAGAMTIEEGTGDNTTSLSNLTLNNYDWQRTIQQANDATNYLRYTYSALPINLPSDQLSLTMVINYGAMPTSQDTPTLLGQLVWSWAQYLPLFLAIYWVIDLTMGFLLRHKVLKTRLIHDCELLRVWVHQGVV